MGTATLINGTAKRAVAAPPAPKAAAHDVGATRRAGVRNRTRVAVGGLIVVVCAFGAAISFSGAAKRVPVLVVAKPVHAGDVIHDSDLKERLIGVDGDQETMRSARRSSVVGRAAAVDLVPGSLLAPGQVTAGPPVAARQSIVGATLKDGQAPVGLAEGDRVLVVPLPAAPGEVDPGRLNAQVPGVVVAVRSLDSGGGVAVSIAVDPAVAAAVAIAGARSQITLVLTAP